MNLIILYLLTGLLSEGWSHKWIEHLQFTKPSIYTYKTQTQLESGAPRTSQIKNHIRILNPRSLRTKVKAQDGNAMRLLSCTTPSQCTSLTGYPLGWRKIQYQPAHSVTLSHVGVEPFGGEFSHSLRVSKLYPVSASGPSSEIPLTNLENNFSVTSLPFTVIFCLTKSEILGFSYPDGWRNE